MNKAIQMTVCSLLGHKKVHRFACPAVSWYCERCGYDYYYMPPNNIRGFLVRKVINGKVVDEQDYLPYLPPRTE